MTSRGFGRMWWLLAGVAVLSALAAEATRPLAGRLADGSMTDLVAAGADPLRVAAARAYAEGQVPILLSARLLRLGFGVLLLTPSVRRRVAGRVAIMIDRRALAAHRAGRRPGQRRVRVAVAMVVGLSAWVASDLLVLPLQVAAWRRSVAAGLSTQDLAAWGRDWAVVNGIEWLGLVVAIGVIVWVIERRPRDWVPVTGLLLGLGSAVLILLAPILLEPLLLRFTPLEQGPLRADIQAIATDLLGEDVDQVLVADASRRGTASNAYVSGLLGTRRVVLYDTLLRDATNEQVLAVVAHEMAHRSHRDIERTTLWTIAGSILAVAALASLLRRDAIDDDGHVRPAVAVPAVGLVLLGMVLLGPAEAWLSRRAESSADATAIAALDDPDTFVGMMVGLAERNLSDPDPAGWTVLLWYSHPPVSERISRALAS